MENLKNLIIKSPIFYCWWRIYCESEWRSKCDIAELMIKAVNSNSVYINIDDRKLKIPIEIVNIIKLHKHQEDRDLLFGRNSQTIKKEKNTIPSQFFQIKEAPDLYFLKDRQYRHLVFMKNEHLYVCLGRLNYTPPEENQEGGSNYYDFISLSDDDLDYLHNFGFEYLDV